MLKFAAMSKKALVRGEEEKEGKKTVGDEGLNN
jgi:hypothetical protein